jgi:hypothetical protein
LLQITGDGDLHALQPPALNLSEDTFEVYTPTVKDGQVAGGTGFLQQKTFIYVVSPVLAGDYTFRPRLCWFDPVAGAYRRSEEPSVAMQIKPGQGKVFAPQPGNPYAAKDIVGDIADKPGEACLLPTWPPVLWVFLLLGSCAGGYIFVSRRKVTLPRRATPSNSLYPEALTQAVQHAEAGEARAYFQATWAVLRQALAGSLGVGADEITVARIQEQALAAGCTEELASVIKQYAQDCELALFAGQAQQRNLKDDLQRITAIYKQVTSL